MVGFERTSFEMGRRERERERDKRRKTRKERRGWRRNSIEKFSLVLPGGHRKQRRESSFPHEVVAAGCNLVLECGPATFSREPRFSIKVSRIWSRKDTRLTLGRDWLLRL